MRSRGLADIDISFFARRTRTFEVQSSLPLNPAWPLLTDVAISSFVRTIRNQPFVVRFSATTISTIIADPSVGISHRRLCHSQRSPLLEYYAMTNGKPYPGFGRFGASFPNPYHTRIPLHHRYIRYQKVVWFD